MTAWPSSSGRSAASSSRSSSSAVRASSSSMRADELLRLAGVARGAVAPGQQVQLVPAAARRRGRTDAPRCRSTPSGTCGSADEARPASSPPRCRRPSSAAPACARASCARRRLRDGGTTPCRVRTSGSSACPRRGTARRARTIGGCRPRSAVSRSRRRRSCGRGRPCAGGSDPARAASPAAREGTRRTAPCSTSNHRPLAGLSTTISLSSSSRMRSADTISSRLAHRRHRLDQPVNGLKVVPGDEPGGPQHAQRVVGEATPPATAACAAAPPQGRRRRRTDPPASDRAARAPSRSR